MVSFDIIHRSCGTWGIIAWNSHSNETRWMFYNYFGVLSPFKCLWYVCMTNWPLIVMRKLFCQFFLLIVRLCEEKFFRFSVWYFFFITWSVYIHLTKAQISINFNISNKIHLKPKIFSTRPWIDCDKLMETRRVISID